MFPIWDKNKVNYSEMGVMKFIIETFKKNEVFGYFFRKNIIGCICLDINLKEKNGEIVYIIVSKDYQGKGIGRELMLFAEKHFKNKCNRIILEVLIKNKAISFYKNFGYKIKTKNKKNKYLMVKILQD